MMLALTRGAEAQDARPPAAIETWAGYARGWGEDQRGNHAQVGAGLRFYVSPRVSLSPRVRYARLFDTEEERTDLYLDGALMFEFRRTHHGRPRMVSPFLLVSGGVRVSRYPATSVMSGGIVYRYPETRSSRAGLTGVMVGARLFLPFARGRMYVAPEVGYANLATMAVPVTFGMPLRGLDDRPTGAQ